MNPAAERCHYCGCVLRWKPLRNQVSLASPEERKRLADQYLADRDLAAYKERLAAFGYEEHWGIDWKCLGCGGCGGSYTPRYTFDEAALLADNQNQWVETPEAAAEAEVWRDAVRRRANDEADRFAELLGERFLDWLPYFERFPEAPGTIREPAAELRIRSENPAVADPFGVQISCGEALLHWFGGWHEHYHRVPETTELHAHLDVAVTALEKFRAEQVWARATYRDGKVGAGGSVTPEMDLYEALTRCVPKEGPGPDRIVIRSFRGTYDRVFEAPFPFGR